MPKENDVGGGQRFQARLDCRIKTPFFIVRDWMFTLGLPDAVVQTYACVWSFTRVPLPTGAPDIARVLGKSERTIRKHFKLILQKGLWMVIPRYTIKGKKYLCAANRYVLLWHPAMPEALRGDAVVERNVIRDARDTYVPAAMDTEVPVAAANESVSRVTGLLKTSGKTSEQASKSASPGDLALPAPLLAELERVMPGHVESCVRVVSAAARGGEPERAKHGVLLALRMLIDRVESGGVENPPGLLRNSLLPDAERRVAAGQVELGRLRGGVQRIDTALRSASTGFAVRRMLLNRDDAFRRYADKHIELIGTPPTDVGETPEIAGELGELVTAYANELAKLKRAQQRSDGLASNQILNGLDALDGKLDELLKGAAE